MAYDTGKAVYSISQPDYIKMSFCRLQISRPTKHGHTWHANELFLDELSGPWSHNPLLIVLR